MFLSAVPADAQVKVHGNVYGGGNLALVGGSCSVTLNVTAPNTDANVMGDVYGGGALAIVNAADTANPVRTTATTVTITKGKVTNNVYGGGLGQIAAQNDDPNTPDVDESENIAANVYGPVTVNVNGGTIGGNVYGCNNKNGAPQDSVTVYINAESLSIASVYGGGNLAAYTAPAPTNDRPNNPVVNILAGTSANVFGGGLGSSATVTGNPLVNINGGTVTAKTFGGGEAAPVTGNTKVNAFKGSAPYVFGGGLGNTAIVTGNTKVVVNQTSGQSLSVTDVFGGGDQAAVKGNTDVQLTAGTISRAFGGGNVADITKDGDNTGSTLVTLEGVTANQIFGGGNEASVGSTATINITNGMVNGSATAADSYGVYGGCNTTGDVAGDITVTITGATIGTSASATANIFGGGLGANTTTGGNITVTYGEESNTHNNTPIVYGDIYGGSALGTVNNLTDATTTDTVGVIILNGKVNGSVYGGGMGQEGDANVAKGQVNGKVTVNIGKMIAPDPPSTTPTYKGMADITGNVFGCNNTNGSPKGDVNVNIFQTNHNGTNAYPSTWDEIEDIPDPDSDGIENNFAIAAVYGGGNKAAYNPTITSGAGANVAKVHVYQCESNTVQTVYGGGNAADATNVSVIIDGGYFNQVFGGGNGKSTLTFTNPGANIFGTASTRIHGGIYGNFFGGSNSKGDVAVVDLSVDNASGCTELIKESFGGANEANISGDVTTTLLCSNIKIGTFYGGSNKADIIDGNVTLNIFGGEYNNVFGGSKGKSEKAANIKGNVELNLYGGTITNAFGGSDINGNITGTITVNVLDYEDANCALEVTNIYGGGNKTPYTPNDVTVGNKPESPLVNVIHVRNGKNVAGSVYGGAKGTANDVATVTSNPKVMIGYYDGFTYSALPSGHSCEDNTANFRATVSGDVYGGGELAAVAGSTHVTIQHSNSSVTNIFGGGSQASVGTATVDVLGGTVSTAVYGGCNTSGTVGGPIKKFNYDATEGTNTEEATASTTFAGTIAVNIKSNLGAENSPVNIYGGGQGENTYTAGDVTVTVDQASNPTIYGDIYGGSALGKVNDANAATPNITKVDFQNGNLHGVIYGGGMGQTTSNDEIAAVVNGNTQVLIQGGTLYGTNVGTQSAPLYGAVFGGCNKKGVVVGSSTVTLTGGTVGANTNASTHANVYGGGLGTNTDVKGNVEVNANTGSSVYGDVYGGSAMGKVNYDYNTTTYVPSAKNSSTTTVTLGGGSITGDIYGGGHGYNNAEAHVGGDVTVNINSGSVNKYDSDTKGGSVYGCNNAAGAPQSAVQVNVNKSADPATLIVYNVFGGGNVAEYAGTPDVNLIAGTVSEKVFGGGNEASVGGGDVTMTGGRVLGGVYGGCNTSGNVQGVINVNITNGTVGTDNNNRASVYGGGYGHSTTTGDNVTVTIGSSSNADNPTIYGDIYGGSALGSVNNSANTNGITKVDFQNGTLNGVIYGGGMGETSPNTVAALVYGNTQVLVKGGTINGAVIDGTTKGAVFGGCNEKGVVRGTATVNLTGGTVGAHGTPANVYGGGLGEYTDVQGSVAVSVGATENTSATVWGDVYGGSAKGKVNYAFDDNTYNPTTATTIDNVTTTVTLAGGSVTGDIYGGGHGLDNKDAHVGREVTVYINSGYIDGNVFGCNNAKGAPQALVTVNVNSGVNGSVYGGGNLADYSYNGISPLVNVNNGTLNSVFGAGKGDPNYAETKATVTANPLVTVGDNSNDNHVAIVSSNVFGGGDAAKVVGAPHVIYNDENGDSHVDKLFGGGNNAGVTGTTLVDMTAGKVTSGVYGGCNTSGTVTASTTVNVNGGTVGADDSHRASVYGGGLGQNTVVNGDVAVVLGSAVGASPFATIHGDVYGGSAMGKVNCTFDGSTETPVDGKKTRVTLQACEVYGDIYGGGHGDNTPSSEIAANVWGDVTVTVNGGEVKTYTASSTTYGGNVFGCNNLYGSPKKDVTVNITKTGDAMTVTNVYGGGNLASYTAPAVTNERPNNPMVNIVAGTVSGKVFGGGKGLESDNTQKTAMVTGNPKVTIGDNNTAGYAVVSGNVYGGGDAAKVTGTTTVVYDDNDATGGALNSSVNNIFGGGNLADVTDATSVTVNNGHVTSDVYGGGAYASTGNTRVDIIGGVIGTSSDNGNGNSGNIYGGGLGDNTHAPTVGTATVNIGAGTPSSDPAGATDISGAATIYGWVYGCNNAKGSPTDDVTVNIFQTAHTSGDPNNTVSSTQYAIAKVFGGGRNADFSQSGKKSTVNVYSCDNTVQYVFGGGDAAAVPGTSVNIYGGRFEQIFGGGNGEQTAANIGTGGVNLQVHGGTIGSLFGGSNQRGTIGGETVVNIDHTGCDSQEITDFFGGSNMVDISNDVTTNIECGTTFTNVYGGSNKAKITGNVTLNILGGEFVNVYGGSKGDSLSRTAANIEGNVTLNLFGGKIENAFGGSNILGNITGKITVNVLNYGYNQDLGGGQSRNCALEINNIYGAGNLTPYTPDLVNSKVITSPVINLIHGTVSKKSDNTGGNVFGGGFGNTANVYANPQVNIGYNASTMGTSYDVDGLLKSLDITGTYNAYTKPQIANFAAVVANNVYGGGEEAPLAGTDTVILQNATSSVNSIYGGGNNADVGNAVVYIKDGSVTAGVYGGCNTTGTVGGPIEKCVITRTTAQIPTDIIEKEIKTFAGNIEVNINNNLGASATPLTEGIFGGGRGQETKTRGNVTVNVDADGKDIYSDIYGGSALGQVSASDKLTNIKFKAGTLHGVIYGGGQGNDIIAAVVSGPTKVELIGGTINGSEIDATTHTKGAVFGGCNVKGSVVGGSTVELTGGIVGTDADHANVYGGGLGVNTNVQGHVAVKVGANGNTSATVYGDVYGGSAKGKVNYSYNGTDYSPTDDTTGVKLIGGTVYGDIYGGGHGLSSAAANVGGTSVTVDLLSGSVNKYADNTKGGSVYGCNNAAGAPRENGSVKVNVNKSADPATLTVYNVFGGGNVASYIGTPHVKIIAGTVSEGVFGGGNEAGVKGGDVVMTGGTVLGGVYGGCNTQGNVTEAITVSIEGGIVGAENAHADVYGGGLGSQTTTTGNVTVTLKGDAVVYGDLYGGSAFGSVCGMVSGGTTRKATVNLQNANLHGRLFGGGKGQLGDNTHTEYTAATLGNVVVNIEAANDNGYLDGVYGGANVKGNVAGSIQVNVKANVGKDANDVCNIFGGGLGANTTTDGEVMVKVGETTNPTIFGDVYGGSALGEVGVASKTAMVYFHNGTLNGNIYGGGMGDDETAAIVTGRTIVEVSGGTVKKGVYGGCNKRGTVNESVTVNIIEGTIGTSATDRANVHGGGYGQNTKTGSNVAVTIGTANTEPTIYGDVYGGSALGSVNSINETLNPACSTVVTMTKGIIHGNLYGGGLGQLEQPAIEAKVWSPVFVTVTGGELHEYNTGTETLGGKVFGCNNQNGSPKGAVNVTINGTNPERQETVGGNTVDIPALHAVYGGGNLAAYIPSNNPDSTTVTVNDCNTSIGDVFGGGNAAPVPAAKVVINGGSIERVFAGGNGESGTPAHVGYNSTLLDVTSAPQYGNGNASVLITSGAVQQVYGGANSNGRIRNHSLLTVEKDPSSTCELRLNQVYGGGNLAAGKPATINVGCTGDYIKGERISELYGGANQADVEGNILLNITGGNIDAVYGGNNKSGSISGTITVNVEITNTSCDNHISNVFGGGNQAAYTGDPVVNIKHGTIYGSVYGAGYGDNQNNEVGKVTGNPHVNIGDANPDHQVTINGNVFGGGADGNVDGTPVVHVLNKCTTTINDDVYGGCQSANVTGTNVIIDGGNINGSVFGGGQGTAGFVAANVGGDVAVTVTGGTIAKVFGGCNSNGGATGTITMNIEKGASSCDMYIGEVYGGGNEAAGNAGTINIGCTGTWTNSHDNHNSTDNRIGYELEGVGTVYGGANAADVGNNIELNITSGIVENAFGGNNTSGSISGTITVNINKDNTKNCDWYVGNVYGGGNQAAYIHTTGNYPAVNIKNGTVANVFGGGLGNTAVVTGNPKVTIGDNAINTNCAIVSGNVYGGGDAAAVTGTTWVVYDDQNDGSHVSTIFGGGNAAGVSSTSTVDMVDGLVTGGIYGGCNTNGEVAGKVTVNVKGGNIGTNTATADIYGGGFGSGTSTGADVEVNFGEITNGDSHTDEPLLYGDIYGGSAEGSVNNSASNNTTVNILNGTITNIATTVGNVTTYYGGNVYGGGLGVANDANKGWANGVVTVNIGQGPENDAKGMVSMKSCNVYGCNNTNGSPQADVNVNIWKTNHDDIDLASVHNDADWDNIDAYAIGDVFGGGNKAAYKPENADINSTKKTHVHVYTCDNSIHRVFGGGDAAFAQGVQNTIEGGRIEFIFGGGNGETGVAADIGAGGINQVIRGGYVGSHFGLCNKNGNVINGGTHSETIANGNCGALEVNMFFCGANEAETIGDVNYTFDCGTDQKFRFLYGGSNLADIKDDPNTPEHEGNVNLTIRGGEFLNVYGGSRGLRASGNIQAVKPVIEGNVTVNLEGGVLGNVYGGCEQNGDIKGKITINVLDREASGCGLVVNNIYGGGFMAEYTPTAAEATGTNYSPEINIIHGAVTKKSETVGNVTTYSGGNVYGGGYGVTATVSSSPRVNVGYDPAIHTAEFIHVFDTQLYNHTISYPATYPTAHIAGDVYGGGALANVTGNTVVKVQHSNTVVSQDVYGGGALADVNVTGTTHTANTTTNVVIGGGKVRNVYGGGLGSSESGNEVNAAAWGPVYVNIRGGEVDSVFGCNNEYGAPASAVTVTVNDSTTAPRTMKVTAVFGGGNQAEYVAPMNGQVYSEYPLVNIIKGTVNGNVFGGGNGKAGVDKAMVTGNPVVTVSGTAVVAKKEGDNSDATGNVFGGGNNAKVTGNPVVKLKDGATVAGDVFGGGNNGQIIGNSEVRIEN